MVSMRLWLPAVLAIAAGTAFAGSSPSPYAGFETRPVKALSAERIEELRAGLGAGYALSAELNGYPGPRHVLDLAEALALDDEQHAAVSTLFDAMRAEAQALGLELIAQEAALEGLLAHGQASEDTVHRQVARIAEVEGRLRATHLRYHLATKALLSENQIADYARLRGYGEAGGPAAHRRSGHRH